MFRVAVGIWAIDPRSFWTMTPREWWFVQDAKNSQRNAEIQASGNLTNSDYSDLYADLPGDK